MALTRWILYRPLRTAQEEQILHAAKQQTTLLETVRGMQSVKLFNRQAQRRTVFQNRLVDTFNANIRIQQLGIWYKSANRGVFCVENVAVIWTGALLVLGGGLSVGMLIAFLAYKQQFIARIVALIDKAIDLKMLGLHAERVADIALNPPETTSISAFRPARLTRNRHRAAQRQVPLLAIRSARARQYQPAGRRRRVGRGHRSVGLRQDDAGQGAARTAAAHRRRGAARRCSARVARRGAAARAGRHA